MRVAMGLAPSEQAATKNREMIIRKRSGMAESNGGVLSGDQPSSVALFVAADFSEAHDFLEGGGASFDVLPTALLQ
jgi:hypothetical protein